MKRIKKSRFYNVGLIAKILLRHSIQLKKINESLLQMINFYFSTSKVLKENNGIKINPLKYSISDQGCK